MIIIKTLFLRNIYQNFFFTRIYLSQNKYTQQYFWEKNNIFLIK